MRPSVTWRDAGAVIVWMVWIAFLSMSTGRSIQSLDFRMWGVVPFDGFAHFVSYAVLAYLLSIWGARQRRWRWWRRHAVKVAVVVSIAYGACLEWGQSFIPGRGPAPADLVANALGALVGGVFFYLLVGNVYRFR